MSDDAAAPDDQYDLFDDDIPRVTILSPEAAEVMAAAAKARIAEGIKIAIAQHGPRKHWVVGMTEIVAAQPNQHEVLLKKLNEAVKAANEAEAQRDQAAAELVSRSKAVGLVLLEAKKLHPKVKDFEAYLNRVDGLGLSRAYDFMRLAGGRATDEQLRKAARERKRKSREKKLKTKSQPLPKPAPAPEPKPEPKSEPRENFRDGHGNRPSWDAQTPKEKADSVSAHNLREFEYACKAYLPKLNEADLKKAHACFTEAYPKPTKDAA